jgi:hypothetical protein
MKEKVMDAERIRQEMLSNKLLLTDRLLDRERIDGQLDGLEKLKEQRVMIESKISAHMGVGERLGVLLAEAEAEEKAAAKADDLAEARKKKTKGDKPKG